MKHVSFLILATLGSTTALAQRPPRAAAERAAAERAAQARDSVRVRGLGGFEGALERLATELLVNGQIEGQLARRLEQLKALSGQQANREQLEEFARELQVRLAAASRDRQALRSQLAALCDRSAKPTGYMGITFSANMRADTIASGSEVFRFAEYPTVETVEPGSPAERAGVEKGDEILLINGRKVIGRDIVFARILRPGSRLPLRVKRDGDVRDVMLVVGERPAGIDNGCPWLDARFAVAVPETPVAALAPRPGYTPAPTPAAGARRGATVTAPDGPRVIVRRAPSPTAGASSAPEEATTGFIVATPTPLVPSAVVAPGGAATFIFANATTVTVAGATIVRMNADLRETFGVDRGVLVTEVARGSPAARSGLKGGDVIVTAGRTPVTAPVTVLRTVESAEDREVTLRIVRKEKPQEIVLRW